MPVVMLLLILMPLTMAGELCMLCWYESVYSECTGCFYTGARQ